MARPLEPILGGASSGLRLLDRQVFTSSGTWTKPADYAGNVRAGVGKILFVRVIGGGGGGTYVYESYYPITYFGGGGGGGMTELTFDVSQVIGSVAVNVGAGGIAGITNQTATNGGSSSFGVYASAEGGAKGQGGGGFNSSAGSYELAGLFYDMYTSNGGAGTTRGSRGSKGQVYLNNNNVRGTIEVPAERGAGAGGGGGGDSASPSGSVPVGSNSSIAGPGPGGANTAGGLYGGGGGFGCAGAQGVAVIEVYG